jgi:hypothetical protein
MRILHPDSGHLGFSCVAMMCYSSRNSVCVARGPDVSRLAADVLVRVSPGRLARSTPCMAAGRPYLYLVYVVDQIARDFRSLAREFVAHAYMRRRMVLLIEIHRVISIISVIRNHRERFRLSMGFITTRRRWGKAGVCVHASTGEERSAPAPTRWMNDDAGMCERGGLRIACESRPSSDTEVTNE